MTTDMERYCAYAARLSLRNAGHKVDGPITVTLAEPALPEGPNVISFSAKRIERLRRQLRTQGFDDAS